MPVYEYACKSCGEHVEVAQSFKDDPLTTCPACGGALRKVFGSIGIAFKGSGFYRTDSRAPAKTSSRDKDQSSAKAESSDGKGEGKTTESKGDSKGDSKTGAKGDSKSSSSSSDSGGGSKTKPETAKTSSPEAKSA